ncbi:motility protein A [Natronogracilivirga saccharolytica]|uniref:MotA/TolQ/ExbB proton channel family protein n=1 Tax=Natronogracilivirga saccharolytica TaxID=2812953 RepID=A0A8J7RKR2_9BACT|nr:MotA/TolQ/ExbB proton channel family protein [Natronogracilivirga saccharolytica]MBP3191943.1 MotA/TolQ/ExbB proton channel family protein [Natronogracilivirga saccharolytica]
MLDRSALIGFLAGFGLIAVAIVSQGELIAFASTSSFFIVFGGVIAATMVNYSWDNISDSFKTISSMMKARTVDLRTDVELMNMFARRARRGGLISLDKEVEYIEDNFLKNGLQLAVDGISKGNLNAILDDQIKSNERRAEISINVLYSMASYAPAFGMIGTVIGMILMLQNISDPESLGRGLSVALLTTLYGTISANMFFNPLAGKLEYLSELDNNRKRMFHVAIMSIVEGENPRIMDKKMLNYVDPKDRATYLQFHDEVRVTKEKEEKLYKYWPEQQNNSWDDLRRTLETG